MAYEPCRCCDATDLPTGHELCGYGQVCGRCLMAEMTAGDDDNEDVETEHRLRHESVTEEAEGS